LRGDLDNDGTFTKDEYLAIVAKRFATGQYCAPTELLISGAVISQFGHR
jgi:hypothetical protein